MTDLRQMPKKLKKAMSSKAGHSAIITAMIFVAMAAAVIASISVSRAVVVKSEAEVFGDVWAKALLSEYDTHLLGDYGIMAFYGDENEIGKKLNYYISYSAGSKLSAKMKPSNVDLSGYELSDPDNFKKALRKGLLTTGGEALLKEEARVPRTSRHEDGDVRSVKNRVVIDTLPSHGIKEHVEVKKVADDMKSGRFKDALSGKVSGTAIELLFIRQKLGNYMTAPDGKESYFENEWEYIVAGKLSDAENLASCRRRIFLIRNALNLAYLTGDAENTELLAGVAAMIATGPAAFAVQAALTEAWAAIESERDVKDLLDGGRVPIMKNALTWKTDLESVLDADDLTSKLDDEARKSLDEKRAEIDEKIGRGVPAGAAEGNTYEDYITFLMLGMSEKTRLLRAMDIVQINMKYRYYEDFNFEEYFTGVRFAVSANGRKYEQEKEYR